MSQKKPVRVWSSDRKQRFGIVAESWDSLQVKISEKFSLGEHRFSIVLEEDGTAVDSAYWTSLEPHKRLVVLKSDEKWEPPTVPLPFLPKSNTLSSDTTDSVPNQCEPVIKMFIELQKNPACLSLYDLQNLEVIKDFDLDEIVREETSYLLDKEFCKVIQDMSIELYVKRKTEADALEFVDLLRKSNLTAHIKKDE